jgi:hypothetical protein
MYADDFDEKEKARIEQQAEGKKNGEETAGVSFVETGESENGSAAGNETASCDQGYSQGKRYSSCVLCWR